MKKKPVVVCGDMNVAHKEIDLKNPKRTGKMPVSPMKKEGSLPIFSMPALQIPSGIFILMLKICIPGGHTGSRPVRKMQGGVSTTSVLQNGWTASWCPRLSTTRSWVLTTARWNVSLIS